MWVCARRRHPPARTFTGSTGKPKGILHTSGGYLTYATFSHRLVFDYRPGDVFACMADVGWITGHSYVMCVPFCVAAGSPPPSTRPTGCLTVWAWGLKPGLSLEIRGAQQIRPPEQRRHHADV